MSRRIDTSAKRKSKFQQEESSSDEGGGDSDLEDFIVQDYSSLQDEADTTEQTKSKSRKTRQSMFKTTSTSVVSSNSVTHSEDLDFIDDVFQSTGLGSDSTGSAISLVDHASSLMLDHPSSVDVDVDLDAIMGSLADQASSLPAKTIPVQTAPFITAEPVVSPPPTLPTPAAAAPSGPYSSNLDIHNDSNGGDDDDGKVYAHQNISNDSSLTIPADEDEATSTTPSFDQGQDYMVYFYDTYSFPPHVAPGDPKLYLFGKILDFSSIGSALASPASTMGDDNASDPSSTGSEDIPPPGKVTSDQLKTHSCCIAVENIDRVMYLLPRKYRLNNPSDKASIDTSHVITMADVKEEIDQLMVQHNISKHRTRLVKKRYCFGRRMDEMYMHLEAERERKRREQGLSHSTDPLYVSSLRDPDSVIPTEMTDYLELRYSTAYPALPSSFCGKTFSHTFGTQTSKNELFLLDRKIRGPTWLKIPKDRAVMAQGTKSSWCSVELTIPSPRDVCSYLPDPRKNLILPPPLFSMASIHFQTHLTYKPGNKHEHEIVMVTIKYDPLMSIESGSNDHQAPGKCQIITLLCPPSGSKTPYDLATVLNDRSQNSVFPPTMGKIRELPNERSMLAIFFQTIQTMDPDIIMGHDLYGVMLDQLFHRANDVHKHGITCSKLGRIKMAKPPARGKYAGQRSLVEFGAGAGRLMCDTQICAREFYLTKNHALEFLVPEMFNGQIIKVIDSSKTPMYYKDSPSLAQLVAINLYTVIYQYKVLFQLNVVPLTKELTSLCGNLWSSTLRGARSERVEFILLHNFTNADFIPPEPTTSQPTPFNEVLTAEEKRMIEMETSSAQPSSTSTSTPTPSTSASVKAHKSKKASKEDDVDDEDCFFEDGLEEEHDDDQPDDGDSTGTSLAAHRRRQLFHEQSKKASYSGGLVLEPKRGFYDHWIAVLDFNSLYPSIIREYDLCFSTTKHWSFDITSGAYASFIPSRFAHGDGDGASRLSSDSKSNGILPKVVGLLIERRRSVRRLIPTATSDKERKGYETKQLALKLVANSMYGCLGFPLSRFFCRPIAACITHFGRKALNQAVDVARGHDVDVVYGDTDSIMVNTQTHAHGDACKKARDIKNDINRQYKVLKIDEDGYFRNILLLRKKKYAALKYVESAPYSPSKHKELLGRYNEPEKFKIDIYPPLNTKPPPGEPSRPPEIIVSRLEVKGLDLVRRDWSILCRQESLHVLFDILWSTSREEIVSSIQRRLEAIGNNLTTVSKYPIESFVISKQLTKSIEQYKDKDSIAHVAVAMRLASQGISVRSGDIVSYVVVRPEDPAAPSGGSISSRVMSKKEFVEQFRKKQQRDQQRIMNPDAPVSNEQFVVLDYEYYKANQLLDPIHRLCEVFEELGKPLMAQWLGLDAKRYHQADADSHNEDTQGEQYLDQLNLNDASVESCRPLYITCPRCRASFPFLGAFNYFPMKFLESTAEPAPLTHATLGMKMHSEGYRAKLMDPFYTADKTQWKQSGLICPSAGCPGFFVPGDDQGNNDALVSLCRDVIHDITQHIASYHYRVYSTIDPANNTVKYTTNPLVVDGHLVSKNDRVRDRLAYLKFLFDVDRAQERFHHELTQCLQRLEWVKKKNGKAFTPQEQSHIIYEIITHLKLDDGFSPKDPSHTHHFPQLHRSIHTMFNIIMDEVRKFDHENGERSVDLRSLLTNLELNGIKKRRRLRKVNGNPGVGAAGASARSGLPQTNRSRQQSAFL